MSARVSASIASWVTRSVTPSYAARCWASSTRRAAATPMSSPAKGSSSSRSRGRVASARAIDTRCACPPESSRGRRPARSPTPNRSSQSWAVRCARSRLTPRLRGPNATFSSAVRCGKRSCPWKARPTDAPRTGSGGCDQERPSTATSPRQPTSPATARSSVDLPAPLGPITATTSPAPADADTCTRPGTARSRDSVMGGSAIGCGAAPAPRRRPRAAPCSRFARPGGPTAAGCRSGWAWSGWCRGSCPRR